MTCVSGALWSQLKPPENEQRVATTTPSWPHLCCRSFCRFPGSSLNIYVYVHQYTLTGHFISLPVKGWTPLCLQNCLNSSIDMTASGSCCRSMMPISRSTTSQSCSVGLRSGDWRPLESRELIVMFKKPVWDDMSFVTWCIILLEAAIRRWDTVLIKGWIHLEDMFIQGLSKLIKLL